MAGTEATWLIPAEYSRSIAGVNVLQVRPDIYMLTTADGANIAVQTGWQGTLVIDTGSSRTCDAVVTAVKALAQAPIRYVVNTSTDADRMGCNAQLAQAGRNFSSAPGQSNTGAPLIAHKNATLQLLASGSPPAQGAMPNDVFSRPVRNMFINEQAEQLYWMPRAHSDADLMVLFRRSDVVVTGAIMDMTGFPVIDLAKGGSINGEIAALNRLMEEFAVAVSPRWQGNGGTLIIPARGRLARQIDVVNYRDMVTIVRDRVKTLVDRGASLEQVRKADPARGYTTRYGAQSGSADTFIAAVYQSLQSERRGVKKQ
jgi:glyoxylase-like metal-dependent hydrolase (beta-lactamase superfamily II)